MSEGKSMSTFAAVFDSVPSVDIVAGPGEGYVETPGASGRPTTLESA
jgi:hypothetical protein